MACCSIWFNLASADATIFDHSQIQYEPLLKKHCCMRYFECAVCAHAVICADKHSLELMYASGVQLEIEKKLRALLTKEKEKAEEEAALSMGMCAGGFLLP